MKKIILFTVFLGMVACAPEDDVVPQRPSAVDEGSEDLFFRYRAGGRIWDGQDTPENSFFFREGSWRQSNENLTIGKATDELKNQLNFELEEAPETIGEEVFYQLSQNESQAKLGTITFTIKGDDYVAEDETFNSNYEVKLERVQTEDFTGYRLEIDNLTLYHRPFEGDVESVEISGFVNLY